MPLSTLATGSERVVVLAMDDALRATIHQTLEVLGYAVTVVGDAEDLLAAVAAAPTDLLVIDGLGRGDSDVLVRAKALRPNLRIIATAHPGRAPEPVAGSSIASLTKPFTLADLAGTVRRTLDRAAKTAQRSLLVEQHGQPLERRREIAHGHELVVAQRLDRFGEVHQAVFLRAL